MPAVGKTAAAAPHADERNCPAAVPTNNPGGIRHSPELPMTHTAEYKRGEQNGARTCEQDCVQDEVIQLALRGCVYTHVPARLRRLRALRSATRCRAVPGGVRIPCATVAFRRSDRGGERAWS